MGQPLVASVPADGSRRGAGPWQREGGVWEDGITGYGEEQLSSSAMMS